MGNEINLTNQGNSKIYGDQYGIGVQNNFVFNLKFYLTQTEIAPNRPYKESSLLPNDAENFFGRDEFVKELKILFISFLESSLILSIAYKVCCFSRVYFLDNPCQAHH
ncbi:hypothetical protein [Okeania sp. SIO1I7]|uniref:hypothetical protein n=1 Tax=Okeania sp. SIO1I7 TaxID=2607772 RepID=UPI0013F8CCC7|nr:hypothetical protein [Okeania sp. SIO1I7]NET25168.1 hypothetical protein [Okeania sp. SIO1I7]